MSAGVSIRHYFRADARDIVRLHRSATRFFEEENVTEEFIDILANRGDFCFYVAESDGNVIGSCGVLFHPSNGRAEIGPLNIDQHFRRMKAGTMLINAVISFLESNDIRRVTVKVKSLNEPAIAFFKTWGFEIEGFFRSYTRKSEDVIQLVKFLQDKVQDKV